MDSAFRRNDGSTPYRFSRHSGFPVIPAQAGIYSPRRTPRARACPAYNRHSGASRNLFAAADTEGPGLTCLQPSFRRKPESTRHDELRFSLERRIHTIPIFPSYRFFRHSGASRNLRAATNSAFRRSNGSTPYRFSRHTGYSVIPAQAGIYALRWTQVFARATDPHHTDFPVIPAQAGIYALRWTQVFARATDPHHTDFPVTPVFPSFRRKPESTRHDGLRFSPERRRACHTT